MCRRCLNSDSTLSKIIFPIANYNNSCSNQKYKYIALKLNILQNNKVHYFYVDSGSDVSLVQKNCIRNDVYCDPNVKLNIRGLPDKCVKTLAAVDTCIQFSNSDISEHMFHIIDFDLILNCAGILGRDFLGKFECVVDFELGTLNLPLNISKNCI